MAAVAVIRNCNIWIGHWIGESCRSMDWSRINGLFTIFPKENIGMGVLDGNPRGMMSIQPFPSRFLDLITFHWENTLLFILKSNILYDFIPFIKIRKQTTFFFWIPKIHGICIYIYPYTHLYTVSG